MDGPRCWAVRQEAETAAQELAPEREDELLSRAGDRALERGRCGACPGLSQYNLVPVLWAGPDSAGRVTGAPPGPFRPAPFGGSLGSRERAQGSRESLGAGQGSLWRCLGLKPCYRAFKHLWRGEILVHGMLAL